jgi:hypothetical protein
MNGSFLKKVPILGKVVDERFLNHRLRSTSLAGIVGCLVAIALFEYRLFANHVWSWDLLSVAITIAGVKLVMMTWYVLTD